MAAPTVLSRATGVSPTTSIEDWSPPLPTVTPGKTLVVWVSADGDDINATESPGWVKLNQVSYNTNVTGIWWVKPLAVGGGEDTLNLHNDTTEQYSSIAWCIDAGPNPQFAWSFSSGSGDNSAPPNLALGAAQEALWIATRAGDSNVAASAGPSGFGNFQSQPGGGTSGASSNSAELTATAASQNPGAFTSSSEEWVCSTLAIWRGPEDLPYVVQYAQSDTPDQERTSATVELYAPATEGNLLLVAVLPDKDPSTITPPAGFQPAGAPHTGGSDISGGLYWKIAEGGEQEFTGSWDTVDERGVLVALEIALASGIDQYAKGGSPTVAARSASAGPVTTTTPNQLAVAVWANDSAWNAGDGLNHAWSGGFMPFAAYLPSGTLNPTGDPGWAVGLRVVPEIDDVEAEYSYTGGNADQTLMLLVTIAPAETSADTFVEPGKGELALQGHAPALLMPSAVSPGKGALAITGHAPSVTTGSQVTPGKGSLAITGHAPSLLIPSSVAPGKGSLAIEGYAPSLDLASVVTPGKGALVIAGHAPGLLVPSQVAPGKGALTFQGHAPSLGLDSSVSPGKGALSIQGRAPSLAAASAVTPGKGALAIHGHAPSLVAATAVTPGKGSLAIQGHAPGLAIASEVQPGKGELKIQGYAPVFAAGTSVEPGAGSLVIQGYAPTLGSAVFPGRGRLRLRGFSPALEGLAQAPDLIPPLNNIEQVRMHANAILERLQKMLPAYGPSLPTPEPGLDGRIFGKTDEATLYQQQNGAWVKMDGTP